LNEIKSPVRVFVLLEERAESINDATFFTDPDTRYQMIDYPASYHSGSCNFSFADGHVETHRWTDRRTIPPVGKGSLLPLNVSLPGNADVTWLQEHANEAR
jgi:prepilin-type processing-associated H-X9-DG protein